MSEASFPLLSSIILLPLLGAMLIGLLRDVGLAKKIGLGIAGIELMLTLLAVQRFNPDDAGFQLVEHYAWIPSLNVQYLIGIDGISVLFLPMTALLTLMAMLASWNAIQHLSRFHLALLLALESITLGVFCALDMVLFFLFWELTLPLIFFLIGLWGIGAERRLAAIKYTLFMLFGGVSLLMAIIILALNHADSLQDGVAGKLAFSLPILLKTPLPDHLQAIVFFLLLLGFIVKAPLLPFHTWLPTVAMEGSTHTTALLVGIKLGVYGLIRFALPLAPSAAVEYSWALGIVGGVTLIYAGLIALRQSNLRQLLAYASISHVGLVVVGIAALNMQGIQGAILQLLNFTLVASSLMLIAGFIQHRLGSTELIHLGGLAKIMPRLTCCYFLFMLASIGIPGTNGFPAELLLFMSALQSHSSLAITALVGAVLSAATMLSFTRKAFLGPVSRHVSQMTDLRPRELLVLVVPAILVLAIGIFPTSVLTINRATAEAWLSSILGQQELKSGNVVEDDISR
ncbi:Proton-translocating NADH-quinone oxidoreductase, chain M [Crenothrix polyspora]|uniref:NADH-quinone oxidoreductase subunit M n=1 Tax=Crenothrix polyspora TaxID=360316 RepID=A0A1R4H614_9GAMM|nr:NADH-quinone oxidoreductase subunit M [Crenothrix polyspora]SJM91705.1 Proton-translocating NADH-quinone oxidoreductase, chain M [Crenothrix polyspora]